MGKFPVIFVSFKTIVNRNFKDAYNQFATLICRIAQQFEYLASSTQLSAIQKEQYVSLINIYKLKDTADKSFLNGSLLTLSSRLEEHHKLKPILLIDEFVVPFA